ncbi:MAG: protein kinase [Gemmatimonadetes bacterium]|nr:protein kinase [Gemmatimonadota bacterium]
MINPPEGPSSGDAPLSPERWARLRALVEGVLALPPDARLAFLDASCDRDVDLRARVVRLVADCERADDGWAFLAQPAGALAAPLVAEPMQVLGDRYAVDAETPLRRGRADMAMALERLRTALADRYRVERELATGGMATVYLAYDLKHDRNVAIKVLHPELSAMLGAERFLSEIKTTAGLHHPNILTLYDSGSADGLLFFVMPLVEGETLRARISREKQLPLADALRIVTDVAGALEYAHKRGVVHRDIKPENILLHEGRPLVADFGIALALQSAGDQRLTRTGFSLGTPPYMSPEQASGSSAIDGRSDVYSLACVLYELLVGNPPFTGSTPQVVIARVLADLPASVRTVRPSVPVHVEATLVRALAKLPADRQATARELAESLNAVPPSEPIAAVEVAPLVRGQIHSRRPVFLRFALGAIALIAVSGATWMASHRPEAPAEITTFAYSNLIDQALFSSVTITPNGRALLYTGSAEAGRPIMFRSLDQLSARALRDTRGGIRLFVAPDGGKLAFEGDRGVRTLSIDGVAAVKSPDGWRYGNGGWDGDDVLVITDPISRGIGKRSTGLADVSVLTRPDTTRGESIHEAPLVMRRERAVVFTVNTQGGRATLAGPLAIAPLDPAVPLAPHVRLGIEARRAFAFVDGWLLFISSDGLAIMAAQLDVKHQRINGNPIVVREVESGDLETASLADNGTLLYLRRPSANSPVLVDTTGAVRTILPGVAGPIMYPRLSPDGKHIAMQGTVDGGNDVWLYDVATRTPSRLTTTRGALHPAWTPDGRRIVFMAPGHGLLSQLVDGSAGAEPVPGSERGFGPSVAPDGKSVVFQRGSLSVGWEVWSASITGLGGSRKVLDDQFTHYMPSLSPDGHWLADVSSVTGQNEVYVHPYPGPGAAVQVSDGGGTEPAWSPDGYRIYYRANGAFMAAALSMPHHAVTWRRQLFRDTFDGAMPHRNYDVAPDGSGFLMITGGSSEAFVVLNWVSELRARLARAR